MFDFGIVSVGGEPRRHGAEFMWRVAMRCGCKLRLFVIEDFGVRLACRAHRNLERERQVMPDLEVPIMRNTWLRPGKPLPFVVTHEWGEFLVFEDPEMRRVRIEVAAEAAAEQHRERVAAMTEGWQERIDQNLIDRLSAPRRPLLELVHGLRRIFRRR